MNAALVPLKRRARVRYGLGQPPQLADEGIPIIRATNIHRGKIVDKGMIWALKRDLPLDRAPLLKAGEVLVVRSGAYTGDSALITKDWEGAAPGYDLRVTPGKDLNPRFLAYSLLGQSLRDQIDIAKMRAAQPHLNAEDLGVVMVRDASLDEQRAVADFLDTETARIDALMAKKRRMIELLNERKTQVRSSAFASEPGWPLKRLLRAPMAYGVLVPQFVDQDGVPMIRITNLTARGQVSGEGVGLIERQLSAEYKRTIVQEGDLILSVVGSMGRSASAGANEVGANLNRALARVQPRDDLPSELLWHWTQTTQFMDFARLATEASSAQPTLNLSDLAEFTVGLPRDSRLWPGLLEGVRRRVARVEASVDALTIQMDLLAERRQALITAAVTGELEIPGVAA